MAKWWPGAFFFWTRNTLPKEPSPRRSRISKSSNLSGFFSPSLPTEEARVPCSSCCCCLIFACYIGNHVGIRSWAFSLWWDFPRTAFNSRVGLIYISFSLFCLRYAASLTVIEGTSITFCWTYCSQNSMISSSFIIICFDKSCYFNMSLIEYNHPLKRLASYKYLSQREICSASNRASRSKLSLKKLISMLFSWLSFNSSLTTRPHTAITWFKLKTAAVCIFLSS